MEPIRVLHVVGKMHRAGLETFIMNIYRNIDRNKIQFDFLTHYEEKGDYDDEIISMGGRIHRFSVMENKRIFTYFKELNIFFKKHQEYKIIHGHWTTFGLFYMYYAKRNGIKHRISHSHSTSSTKDIRGRLVDVLAKTMKYYSNIYFACSKSAANWLYGRRSKIIKGEKHYIIKNAIDLEKFKYNESSRKQIRRNLNVEGKFIIGHIGRFNGSKNHDFIIEVFKKVIKRNKSAVLFLIGNGPKENEIKRKVIEFDLENQVFFLGSREDIPELLSAMDVFLFPSKYEALGIVAIESQSIGLPTFVSEAIPKEAFVTDLIISHSLLDPINTWADTILSQGRKHHVDTRQNIASAGYDIKELVKYLTDYYIKLIKKQ